MSAPAVVRHTAAVDDLDPGGRRVAPVTGVERRAGIGAAVVGQLAADGFDVALTYRRPYDGQLLRSDGRFSA